MAEELAPWLAKPAQQNEGGELAPWLKPQQEVTPVPTWSEVPGRALQSAPHSAVEFAKNVAAPFMDLGEYGARGIDWTAQKFGAAPRAAQPTPAITGMSEIGQGVMQKLGMMKGDEHIGAANAVGKFLMDRYGSVEGIKKTMAEDPVGLAADVSTVLSGGAALAGRVPGVGGILSKAARVTDPLTLVGKATSPVVSLGTEALGLTTGAGGEAIKLAGKAGYEGGEAGKAFRENIRGIEPREGVVADFQNSIDNLRQKRGSEYIAAKEAMFQKDRQFAPQDRMLDFDKLDEAIERSGAIKTFKGQELLEPRGAAMRDQLNTMVDQWKGLPRADFHTIEGLDALKQKVGNVLEATEYGSPERNIAGKYYHAIRQTIVDWDPAYAKLMEGYDKATREIKTLEREFSAPWTKRSTGNVNTALRKMQSALRDNVNTAYGNRLELAKYIANNGSPELLYKLAGQTLNPIAPRGLARLTTGLLGEVGAALVGMGHLSLGSFGAGAGALAFASPRLVGETAYLGGKGLRGARELAKPSYLSGRISEAGGFKKGGRVTRTINLPRYADGGPAYDPNYTGPVQQQWVPDNQGGGQMYNVPATSPPSDAQPSPFGGAPTGIASAYAGGTDPGQWALTRGDQESPLAYMQGPGGAGPLITGAGWGGNDNSGYFTLRQLFQNAGPRWSMNGDAGPQYVPYADPRGGVPSLFEFGADRPSTNNWRLVPGASGSYADRGSLGPGWIVRNGIPINYTGNSARYGLPYGMDQGFTTDAENHTPGAARMVSPGAALSSNNFFDAYYWPGAAQFSGYNRYPYMTSVKRGGRINLPRYQGR